MRALLLSPPSLGHLFPMVPLAWALRASGHTVLVGTTGEALDAATTAGLSVVDITPSLDFRAALGVTDQPVAERTRQMRERGLAVAEAARTPDAVLARFAAVSAGVAPGALRLAERWQPDVVVHARVLSAGSLVARALEIPAIEHGFGFIADPGYGDRARSHLNETYRALGVPAEAPQSTVLHISPPSMRVGYDAGPGMRYVPYNGGGLLPGEPHRGGTRVAVTLGTVVPAMAGTDGIRPLLDALAGIDADVVLALGSAAAAASLGVLPPRVTTVGWVPLNALLEDCDAVVHHGGAGTTLTALCAGIPQLVLPHGADHFLNGDAVRGRGVGLACEPEAVVPDVLTRLLSDSGLRAAATEVRDEIASLPAPTRVVDDLERYAVRQSSIA